MSYYISYDSLDQFTPVTVHSDTVHNTPHNRLIVNDVALDNQLYSVSSSVSTLQSQVAALQAQPLPTLTMITPTLIYRVNNHVTTGSVGGIYYFPPEMRFANSASYASYINTYQSHAYPWIIPSSGVRSVVLRCWTVMSAPGGGNAAWMSLRSTTGSLFPEQGITSAWGGGNGDSNTVAVDVEMPYEPSRQITSYCAGYNTIGHFIFAVGYRS